MSKSKNFSDTAASRYSLALYELAEENKHVQEIEDQSFALIKLLDESKDFKLIVKNPTSKKEDQINVINKISEHYSFNILLKNFLCFLVEKRRLFFLQNILRNFADICSQKRGEVKARLVAAKQLNENEVNKIATEKDWKTEYLSPIISVKTVNGVTEAIDHINQYGSSHTDSIVTKNKKTAKKFLSNINSSIVVHNASTQFADGGEFGFGAEVGISTNKLHPRGPIGLDQLTTYKYILEGKGQIRK